MADATARASASAVELLLNEAHAAHGEGRYQRALAAGERATRAAEELDDPALLVRALVAEAKPLAMLGRYAAALARHTRVLAMADDPSLADRLGNDKAARAVARAYLNWVAAAQFLTGIAVRDLFGVLDAAERWMTATGRLRWRSGILFQRASLYRWLGELDAAIAAAQEGLSAHRPNEMGYTLASHHGQLGDILRQVGRHSEARPHYQAVLDDPGSNMYGRSRAHKGLAWSLRHNDVEAARRHAAEAVRLAEPLGDNLLCGALEVLVAVQRTAGDLDTAAVTATRYLETAGRVGGSHQLYFAVRQAVEVALDRGDLDTGERLLTDLDAHAAALDATTGATNRADVATKLRARLTRLRQARVT